MLRLTRGKEVKSRRAGNEGKSLLLWFILHFHIKVTALLFVYFYFWGKKLHDFRLLPKMTLKDV